MTFAAADLLFKADETPANHEATMTIDRVTCRWDDQHGSTPGWYCEGWSGDNLVVDSQKVWFPVEVDRFDRDAAYALAVAIFKTFPGADIVMQ